MKRPFATWRVLPRKSPSRYRYSVQTPEQWLWRLKLPLKKAPTWWTSTWDVPPEKWSKTGPAERFFEIRQPFGDMVAAVRKVCTVPLTVKIRAGWSPPEANFLEIARIIEDCGADAVTVHPRFVKQGFSGQADWGIIREVKKNLGIPVIGNGDVFKPELALKMREETGCDGVMIGRGAMGNPWIFRQILDLEQGLEARPPDLSERRAVITTHFELLSRIIGENRASKLMRGLLLGYTKGLPHSSRFRGSFTGIKDFQTMVDALDRYFDTLMESQEVSGDNPK